MAQQFRLVKYYNLPRYNVIYLLDPTSTIFPSYSHYISHYIPHYVSIIYHYIDIPIIYPLYSHHIFIYYILVYIYIERERETEIPYMVGSESWWRWAQGFALHLEGRCWAGRQASSRGTNWSGWTLAMGQWSIESQAHLGILGSWIWIDMGIANNNMPGISEMIFSWGLNRMFTPGFTRGDIQECFWQLFPCEQWYSKTSVDWW